MMKKLRDFLLVAAVALSVWELLVRMTGVPPYILPGPLQVASAAIEYAEMLVEHTLVTLSEVLVGLILGTILGAGTSLFLVVAG